MVKLKCSYHLMLCFSSLIFIYFSITSNADIDSERSALLALRSAVGGRTLLWNGSESTPCNWTGVRCSADKSSVVELRLPGMSLTGAIPPNTISNLTKLNTLSLRYNALVSPLPSDLSNLKTLRNLYLQHNSFSGPVPEFIFALTNLIRLNLENNKFSGPIPASFNNLTRLGTLYLQDNDFSGSIPDLKLGSLDQFNVSNNNLTGRIPDGLSGKSESAFLGNSLCGKPLALCDGETGNGNGTESGNGNGNGKGKKLSGGAIAGIVIGCIVVLLIIFLILFFLCCKRGKKDERSASTAAVGAKQSEIEIRGEKEDETREREGGFAAVGGSKEKEKVEDNVGSAKKGLIFFGKREWSFELDDLLKASAEVLGKGTFGTAYKAILENGVTVAVKRLRDVLVPEKEFREKMEEIGKMDHENLVPLRAYYYNMDEKLLVFEYLPLGSLSALLHGNKGAGRTPLNWETRARIALGAARGITYLHAQGRSISHGNIKSSNVLLTKNYEARVSDFGLGQVVAPSATPNRVAGYRAPEVTDPRRVSQKADVYSFGVLLLELLTGRAPAHAIVNEEGLDLPRWVQSIVKEEWTSEVFDLELLRYQNIEEDMVQLLQLAINCTAQYPDNRPSMPEVTKQIEELCNSSIQDERDDIVDFDSSAPPS